MYVYLTTCTKSSSIINLLVPMHYIADPSNSLGFIGSATATNRKLVSRYVRERESMESQLELGKQ